MISCTSAKYIFTVVERAREVEVEVVPVVDLIAYKKQNVGTATRVICLSQWWLFHVLYLFSAGRDGGYQA